MYTLLLRLTAPLQSWGVGSKFNIRGTEREPTKSGAIGLLAAALGILREDDRRLEELSLLRFGVRVDREGILLKDFHMAHSSKPYTNKNSFLTYRYYLSDAVFLCGLESDRYDLLQQYEHALRHPVFPLFLGRRSCPPTLPLVLGIRNGGLEETLRNEPFQDDSVSEVRVVIEDNDPLSDSAMVKDVPVSFSQLERKYAYRKCREFIISTGCKQEHDPFAELEAQNVSDKN